MTFDNLLLNLMKVLKYNIIAKLIIKKHKRDAEIIFSVIKNIKKNKKIIFFEGTLPLIIAFQKVNKQHCKILTFKYPIMSQYNYPKINKIPPPPQPPLAQENYVFFHNVQRNTIIDSRVTIYYFRFSRPFFHHHNPAI